MASLLSHFHCQLLVLVISYHPPGLAIAQVNNNVNVGSNLFATDNSSTWSSISGNFAFGFHWLPGKQDQFLLAIWFAKIPDETIVWFAERNYTRERQSKAEWTPCTQSSKFIGAVEVQQQWESWGIKWDHARQTQASYGLASMNQPIQSCHSKS